MRLTPQVREVIRNTTQEVFGVDAQAKLFGSRTDDTLRGGDIDLLIELSAPQPEAHKKSLTLTARLQRRLGDQRIDILVVSPDTTLLPIHRAAQATAIPI